MFILGRHTFILMIWFSIFTNSDTSSQSDVMALASVSGLQDTVSILLGQLEQCSKALNNFLGPTLQGKEREKGRLRGVDR